MFHSSKGASHEPRRQAQHRSNASPWEARLRPTDTVVLTIVNIEERQVRNSDGSTMNADVLIGQADNGTRYTVRLNNVTARQLVRLFGPDTDDMDGKLRLHSRRGSHAPFTKGDKSYVSFANAPARTK